MPAFARYGHRRRSMVVAAVAALGLLAAACSSGGSDGSSNTTSTTTTSTTTSTSSTAPSTATTAPHSTQAPNTSAPPTSGNAPTPLPTDAQGYADAFVRAFGRGDAAALARLGTDDAQASALKAEGVASDTFKRQKCEGAAGSSYCTYRDDDRSILVVHVANEMASKGEDHAVVEFKAQAGSSSSSALPKEPELYADAFVRAFGRGDAAVLGQLGSESARTTALKEQASASNTFRRQRCEGAGGTTYCTYRDDAGTTLKLQVLGQMVAEGTAHAVGVFEVLR